MGKSAKKATKSVSKGFKKVTKAIVKTPLKQISKEVGRVPKNVGGLVTGVLGGGASGGTIIQQMAEESKQRYASEEGQATEQGATDLKTRLGVGTRKKIKRLTTLNKK